MNVSEPASDDPVIRLNGVTRRFGGTLALDDVRLDVPRGAVFGLVGPNGAGKTTLLKHVLGLLKAPAGSVRVFGRDPVGDTVFVLARIGYLAEENDLPGWMRVAELMRYTQAFYPAWDPAYAEALRQAFDLDPRARIGQLSKGQRARAGLIVALAHRPELLIFDEPSSGLDPIVRRDILGAVIRTIADEGRTVVFSSHLLDEVERVSDHVALIDRGRILFSAALDALKDRYRRLTVRFSHARHQPPVHAGVVAWHGEGYEWTAMCKVQPSELQEAAVEWGARVVAEGVPSLDEIFVAQVGSKPALAER